VTSTSRCPVCRRFLYLDSLTCPDCAAELGFHVVERGFVALVNGRSVIDGSTWYTCSQRGWGCNWLVRDDAPAGRCFSCRLTRTRPESDDTLALEKLASTEEAKRRLLIQLADLGLPVEPWDVRPGGLGFDLLSSRSSGQRVIIGHANGIVTIDLAESLDDVREALRIRLGEPYRTMLGHLRHEVGHYYQTVLVTDEETWARCRALFGDERASYQEAIQRHYRLGAPATWTEAYISEYATMHPWEDFAETFAHYLHITGTLQTASMIGMRIDAATSGLRDIDVVPDATYSRQPVERLLVDWAWFSQAFNRINRAMGQHDLYPFRIPEPAREKLAFIHDLVTRAPLSLEEQVALARGTAHPQPEP
jgi:hypothetical protein